MRVFIENASGARRKNVYDARTLQLVRSVNVSAEYPYPYGFVLETMGGDGDAVDCFVLTEAPLLPGATVQCEPIGLLEQIEDGKIDHKVLGVPRGCVAILDARVAERLKTFIMGVFAHIEGKRIELGRLLDRRAAENYLMSCRRVQ
jgi:inorganic pyrophosphatase